MSRTRHEAVPESQHERNEAFLRRCVPAMPGPRRRIARADPPADATDTERERWRIRRRLYRTGERGGRDMSAQIAAYGRLVADPRSRSRPAAGRR